MGGIIYCSTEPKLEKTIIFFQSPAFSWSNQWNILFASYMSVNLLLFWLLTELLNETFVLVYINGTRFNVQNCNQLIWFWYKKGIWFSFDLVMNRFRVIIIILRLKAFLQDALPIEEMNPAEVHCEMADVVLCLGTR